MKEITINQGQTLTDIAIQEYGAFEAAIYLAIANGISITDTLTPGKTLTSVDMTFNKITADYLKANDVHPASAAQSNDGYDRIFANQFANQFA